jgi:inward rectifier potassium channel
MANEAKQRTRLRHGQRTLKIGDRHFVSEGLKERFWDDIYHRALTYSWPTFFGLMTGIFLILNAFYGVLYELGDHGIANQFPKGFAGAFFFSVETLATVGYGDMHPQTIYAHCVATIEIITGMGGIAVVTGLIFARFSRPRARISFSKNPVVRMIDGKLTLMMRAANTRQNMIAQASAQMHLLKLYRSAEGFQLRKIEDLKLVRDNHPIFVLSWSVMHIIDETSPLFGATAQSLADNESLFMLTIEGIDETTAQPMLAHHQWNHIDLRWNHRYADLIRVDSGGINVIDYRVFDDVVPLEDIEQTTT